MKLMKYISNPNVEIVQSEGKVSYRKTFIPNDLVVLDELSFDIYRRCKNPISFDELSESKTFETKLFEDLIDHHIICLEEDLHFLKYGFLSPPRISISKYYSWKDFLKTSKAEIAFLFFGVPIDTYGAKGGARFGSHLIREMLQRPIRKIEQAKENNSYVYDFELRRKVDPKGLQLFDVGDIFCHPLESQKELGAKIGKVVRAALENNSIPIMLGGDHSITFHSVNVLGEFYKKFGIIHFDAHHDIYVNSRAQQNSLNHGNAFAHLLQREELVQLRQIGLRTFDFLN